MRTQIFRLLFPAILLLSEGCTSIEIAVTPAPSPVVVKFTPIPTFTRLPIVPTKLSTEHITPTSNGGSYIPYYVTTSADNVNLRTEPGTLFPVSRLLAKGNRLQVQGHALGGQWLYVLTGTKIYGWVLVSLVNDGHETGLSPLVQPQNVQVVKGQVIDLAGVPISGIGFAVTQGSGPNAPRTDATTDTYGMFYAYLPSSVSGQWLISYVSVACTSNTMDANCNCISERCGKAAPDNKVISLPYTATLDFAWK